MATFPRTSGTAKLATIPLANTLDFHVATTDWLKFTNQFVNEMFIGFEIHNTSFLFPKTFRFFLLLPPPPPSICASCSGGNSARALINVCN